MIKVQMLEFSFLVYVWSISNQSIGDAGCPSNPQNVKILPSSYSSSKYEN
jgi:hypothetical protein